MSLARIQSVPDVTFQYVPLFFCGWWMLSAHARTYPPRWLTLGWGFAHSRMAAIYKAEAILENHGALQPPPVVFHG